MDNINIPPDAIKFKIHSKNSLLIKILLLILAFTVLAVFLSISDMFGVVESVVMQIFVFACIFIAIFIDFTVKKQTYVSDMIITSDSIVLVYNYGNKFLKNKIVPKEEIKKFLVSLKTAYNLCYGAKSGTVTLNCPIKIIIETKKGNIEFDQGPSVTKYRSNYNLMLKLIENSKYIPCFHYQVTGNAQDVIKDVNNFAKSGKRCSFIERFILKIKSVAKIHGKYGIFLVFSDMLVYFLGVVAVVILIVVILFMLNLNHFL